jgi:riboflavin biosynthesis pyrimidine reductase
MIDVLWEEAGLPEESLPPMLRTLYGGGIGFRRPTLYANFVQTLDGVVAVPELEKSNALIADDSEADRFVMGLLRACAHVVLIGSGTLLASPEGTWRPDRAFPKGADAFAELRARCGLPERPVVAVVSSGASLDPQHPVLREAVVLTTTRGAEQLSSVLPDVVAVNDGDWVDVRGALDILRARGHTLVLSEAGPTLFGSLLADGLVDELFLTLSPMLAGRLGAGKRLGLVEGVELLPQMRAAPRLVSVRRAHASAHLFLRYLFLDSASARR